MNFFFLTFNAKHGLLGEAAPRLAGKDTKNVEGRTNYRHDIAIKGGVQVRAEVKYIQNCSHFFVYSDLREAARNFRESKISNEKSNFFLFYQNIPFCELVSKKIF